MRQDVMKEVVDGIEDFVGRSSVVDFGVGTGRFAAPLAQLGVDVVGLDVSLPMMSQARDKGVAGLVLATAESTPFRAQSFDYAMVVHFMHLLKDWRATVKEISRVSRKGLIAVVNDPEGSRPRDLYIRLRESRGFPMAGLKMGERDMVSMVRPSLMRRLSEYREEFDPAQLMDEYAAKLHSITWEVPDDVNRQIVGEMRSRLGEKRELERSVTLVVWDRDQLRRFDPSP
jgi:ubiquinone/menaquinone biosynthesis C-methylase UbiE